MQNQNPKKRGILSSLMGSPTPAKESGLAYSICACAIFLTSFVTVFLPSAGSPTWAIYVSFLISPIAFVLTAIWYFSSTDNSLKSFVKEQKCHPKYFLVTLLLQIGLFSLGELNVLFLSALEKIGYQGGELLLPSMDGWGFLGVLLTVALLPAIMEEVFFRGILLRGMKDISVVAQILLCGGLFALYHQNPAQTAYQFVCGVGFALVAVRAGSFLPTVLAHFINNAVVLTLYKLEITSYPPILYAILLSLSVLCLIFSIVYLFVIDRGKEEKKPAKKEPLRDFFRFAAFGIAVFALTWVLTLVVQL